MSRPQKEITAYHEAGHAVMAWSCNLLVSKISIVASDDGLGLTALSLLEHQRVAREKGQPEMLKRLVLYYVGGIAGDYAHWNRDERAKPDEISKGHSNDQSKASDLLRVLGHDGDLGAYLAMAANWTDKPQVWSVLEEVAKQLMEKEELAGPDLTQFSDVTPRLTSDFFSLLDRAREQFAIQPKPG
jgi:hypothetical protein